MRRPTVIALAFGALLLLGVLIPRSAVAGRYVLHHPKHEHCRAHYVRKVERVKVHRHHRVVRVRRVFCVYRAPKPTPKQNTSAMAPATPVVKLHAHLDPTFTQDPKNPRAVTYSYSASATQTSGTLSAQPASLPEGVLNLYSDGLLVCSANVGGSVTGAQCPVTYSALGEHTVVTTYSSGSASATETSIEHVEPFSTTTTLSVAGSCLTSPIEASENGGPPQTVGEETLCAYTLTASSVNGYGVAGPGGGELLVAYPSNPSPYWNTHPAYTFPWNQPTAVRIRTQEVFAAKGDATRCWSELRLPQYEPLTGACHESWTLTAFYEPATIYNTEWLASQSAVKALAS